MLALFMFVFVFSTIATVKYRKYQTQKMMNNHFNNYMFPYAVIQKREED